jgi:DNA-directed RNA polymerase subunit M/transcription elongation factor TFIIS
MSSKIRKMMRETLKKEFQGKKPLTTTEINEIEESIYNMCKNVPEEEYEPLTFSEYYTNIAYEKLGQLISKPKLRSKIVKDIKNQVVDDWGSIVYEDYRKLENRDTNHQVVGMKVEKGIFQCHNKICLKKRSKGWNTTFYSMQIRSVDEGMSSFVNCHDCKRKFQVN